MGSVLAGGLEATVIKDGGRFDSGRYWGGVKVRFLKFGEWARGVSYEVQPFQYHICMSGITLLHLWLYYGDGRPTKPTDR